jgi:predicted transcriptional regulator
MKEKIVQDILGVSQTFSSGKRLLLLFILKDKPMGYTSIVKSFENMRIPIGSSEVYKHLSHLLREGFIVKNTKSYVLTLRGFRAVENTVDIIETPPAAPEVEITFKRKAK